MVNISAEKGRATGDPDQREARSAGSGFIIDPVGLIVTNNHVIEGATDIYVGFADGSRRVARVEGRDAKSDIALLRIWPGKPLPTLTKPLRSVDISTREPAEALRERTDSCTVPADGVVGGAMVALVLAGAYREKFGGDHIDDVRQSVAAYCERIGWRRR